MSGSGRGVRLIHGEATTIIKVGLPASTLARLEAFATTEKLDRSKAAWHLIDQALPISSDRDGASQAT